MATRELGPTSGTHLVIYPTAAAPQVQGQGLHEDSLDPEGNTEPDGLLATSSGKQNQL
jgi:hypothetical protein